MEAIGEAAKLYVWFEIVASVVLAPVALYIFWRIFKQIFKGWER
jgi:ABC-type nickel/cobalt efflux system permease component RcnA